MESSKVIDAEEEDADRECGDKGLVGLVDIEGRGGVVTNWCEEMGALGKDGTVEWMLPVCGEDELEEE